MKITVKGMSELNRKINTIPARAKGEVSKELMDIIFDLMGKSQRRAPIDLGDLRGSAFAEMRDLEGTVGYTEPYALRQHETHKSKGKYLENPFKENNRKYINGIGNAVKRAVK